MQLNDFIQKTLLDIYTGLRETNLAIAKAEGKTLGKDISAAFAMDPHKQEAKDGGVMFDVAVTVGKESKEAGGGKINVVVATLGADTQGSDKTEVISRIKFRVLPHFFIG